MKYRKITEKIKRVMKYLNLIVEIREIQKHFNRVNKKIRLDSNEKKMYKNHYLNQRLVDTIPIMNTYQLSNIIGIKWNVLKDLISNTEKHYHTFFVSKRNSPQKRSISAPNEELLMVQKFINSNILGNIKIHKNAYGYVKNKSIIDNARYHLGAEKILNVDIENFFDSINNRRVYSIFRNLCMYDKNLSYCLTKLTTKGQSIPQGAPTSPAISNIVSFKLDIRLSSLAKSKGIKYSRYVDDITFSGPCDKIDNKLLKLIEIILAEEGFRLNSKKTKFLSKNRRQEVTGIVINDNKLSIKSSYIKKIRQELYYIEKYGLDSHLENENIYNLNYIEHLKGKIIFVNSIDSMQAKPLFEKFNKIFD